MAPDRPTIAVVLTTDQRDAALSAMRLAARNARLFYRPATGGITGGWVDFHPWALTQAIAAFRDAATHGGCVCLEMSRQQSEAVVKVMLGSTLRKDKNWRAHSLAIRKAIGAAAGDTGANPLADENLADETASA